MVFSFLTSFIPSFVLSFLYCIYIFISCLSIKCVIFMLCVLQGEEAMLSAMVDVAEALVTDMFQAKTCYRKIFSV